MDASTKSHSSDYVYSERVVLNVDEKRCSPRGEIIVKNTSDGTPVFKLEHEGSGCMSYRREMHDMEGKLLLKNYVVYWSCRGRMRITRPTPDGEETAFYVRERGRWCCGRSNDVLVWKGASDQGEPYMAMSGFLLNKKFVFEEVSTGKTMATVARKSDAEQKSSKDKPFFLTVEPGYDVALLSFLSIILYLKAVVEVSAASAAGAGSYAAAC